MDDYMIDIHSEFTSEDASSSIQPESQHRTKSLLEHDLDRAPPKGADSSHCRAPRETSRGRSIKRLRLLLILIDSQAPPISAHFHSVQIRAGRNTKAECARTAPTPSR